VLLVKDKPEDEAYIKKTKFIIGCACLSESKRDYIAKLQDKLGDALDYVPLTAEKTE
jgi:hypothetical protein